MRLPFWVQIPALKPNMGVVGPLDRFGGRAEGENAEDRSEDFFAGNPMGGGHAGKEAGPEPIATLRKGAFALHQVRALGHAGGDEFLDLGELIRGMDRTDIGVFVQRIADPQRCEPVAEARDHFIVDTFLDEETAPGATDVALVEVDPVDDPFDRFVEGGVFHDDLALCRRAPR